MNIIDKFLKKYNQEYDFYKRLSEIVSNKLEKELYNAWIKCIVSSRAKSISSLKLKLQKRYLDKKYKTIDEIYDDINDFSWVRVALYFPSDIKVVSEIIEDIFIKIKEKSFPETDSNNGNRFSWYWAKHYRVELKKEKSLEERYLDSKVEIQIASLLMHAWAEVEHDLKYKPLSWDLTKEEKDILEEINWLVLVWEIALERLQKSINTRIAESKEITNTYESYNIISPYFKEFDNIRWNIRDINKFLFEFNDKIKVKELEKTINEVNENLWINKISEIVNKTARESILKNSYSDLLINNYLYNDISKKSWKTRKYLSKYYSDNKVENYTLFVKKVILLEEINLYLIKEWTHWYYHNRKDYYFLDKDNSNLLKKITNVKNKIVHWLNLDFNIAFYMGNLDKIIDNALKNIKDKDIKNKFINKLNNL